MNFLPSTLKRQGGFTLLETMVAIALFTIGALGIAAMQIRAIHGNASGQRLTEASAQAQESIERITELPFSTLVVGTSTSTVGPYTVTQDIAAPPVASTIATTDAFWVTITVSWNEAGGIQRSVPLTFITSNNVESSYEP